MELVILFGWIVCGAFAAYIAAQRGASGCLWLFLGFVFGPFALAASFVASSGRVCPRCKSSVHPEATRCAKCQADLNGGGAEGGGKGKDDAMARALVDAVEQSKTNWAACKYCGARIPTSARFCNECGLDLRRPPSR